jgi:hypothetical protein
MHIINVYVRGGTIQYLSIPQECDVVIRIVDYDGDGPDTDDKGIPCTVGLYETSKEAV